jgi:2-methylisocitrate lyase-like PEP mutase family enzyme
MTLRELVAKPKAYLAPAVFNPLCAKIAQQAGFEMLYLGGGTLGYIKCGLEANLNVTELAQAGVEIRAVSDLPLILDGACGFGDPMHISPRTPEQMRFVGERLGAPLMTSLAGESHGELGMTLDEAARIGFRIFSVPTTQLAFHHAMQQTYRSILQGVPNPAMGGTSRKAEHEALHQTLGFDRLIEIEKATVER